MSGESSLTIDDQWGWCRSCHGLFSFDAIENPWSCPAGGRHNRNPDPAAPLKRCGSYRLTRTDILAAAPERSSPSLLDSELPGLVAYFPLAEHVDDVLESEHRRSTVQGDVSIGDGPDLAARFNGGHVSIADPRLGLSRGEMSLSWWMRADPEQPQHAVLFDHRRGLHSTSPRARAAHGFSIFINGGRLGVQLADGSSARNFLDDRVVVAWARAAWVMVTVTVGTRLRFFVDGALLAERSPAELGSCAGVGRDAEDEALVIGGHRLEGGASFRGQIADVRVFDRELEPEEVFAVHRRTAWRAEEGAEATGWMRCAACGLLVHRTVGHAVPLGCHATGGGEHVVERFASFDPGPASSDGAEVQAGWAQCEHCATLYFAPFESVSSCGRGGRHQHGADVPALDMRSWPDFAHVDRAAGFASLLFVGVNRQAHTVLELRDERRYLDEVLADSPIRSRGVLNPDLERLRRELRDNAPRYVQFSAHGVEEESDEAPSRGALWLGDDDQPVEPAELAAVFADVPGVELVVVNACHSSALGEAISAHVPHVVVIRGEAPTEASVFFTPLFYEQLTAGASIEVALETACRQLTDQAHFTLEEIPMFVDFNEARGTS